MKILSFDVGIINLAYCILSDGKITHWEIISLNEPGKAGAFNAKISSSSVSDLYINLIKNLDQREFLLDVDLVLIEKQPSFNPKMRIIAGCLQTYFYIRGVVDRVEKIGSVEFFSPKNKLKCYTGPELDISKNGKIVKGKYAQTKKMGILIARNKLEENSETNFKPFFENSKKKDDLSDCYLQALTYIMFNQKKGKNVIVVKNSTFTKKDLKEFLDSQIKNCSVIELCNQDFKTINQIEFPNDKIIENIETTLAKFSMKKYLKFKYI